MELVKKYSTERFVNSLKANMTGNVALSRVRSAKASGLLTDIDRNPPGVTGPTHHDLDSINSFICSIIA